MDTPQGLTKFRATDREECGVIVRDKERTYVLKVPNHAERDEDYVILLDDVNRIKEFLDDGEEVVGFVHTHLSGHKLEPSDQDLSGSEIFPSMLHLIYKPATEETLWYGVIVEEEVGNN